MARLRKAEAAERAKEPDPVYDVEPFTVRELVEEVVGKLRDVTDGTELDFEVVVDSDNDASFYRIVELRHDYSDRRVVIVLGPKIT